MRKKRKKRNKGGKWPTYFAFFAFFAFFATKRAGESAMMSRVLEISRNFRPQPETPSSTETSHIAPTRTDGQISPQSQPDTCEISEISEIRCRLGASWFELMCQIDDLGIARVYDGKATYPGDMPPFQKVLADQTDWLPGDEYPGEEEEDTGYRTEDSESDYVPF